MSVLHRQPTLGSLPESFFGSITSISETLDNSQTQIINKPLARELTGVCVCMCVCIYIYV